MSGPKWTPAQQAAIADRGGALLVSAAAGSGKTALLAALLPVLTGAQVTVMVTSSKPVVSRRNVSGTTWLHWVT